MTTNLEKQFFETFEIEERCETDKHCCNWLCDSYHYPQITDRHYLELICIINKFDIYFDYFYQEDYEVLKETILEDCINLNYKLAQERFNKLKHQVQELFKGE